MEVFFAFRQMQGARLKEFSGAGLTLRNIPSLYTRVKNALTMQNERRLFLLCPDYNGAVYV